MDTEQRAVSPELPPGTPEPPIPLPLPKGVRIAGPDRVRLAKWLKERFNGDMSIPDLSALVGRDRGWVYLVLGEAGLKFNRQNPVRRQER